MEFRLFYRGPLKSNGGREQKQMIRRVIHPQLAELWRREPLTQLKVDVLSPPAGRPGALRRELDPFVFLPLVGRAVALVAELDILFLRPQAPGQLVQHGGDIDNRVKTLLDALRVPLTLDELPPGDVPREGEEPFYALLEDDALITRLAVTTDQLLAPAEPGEVLLVIHVTTKAVRAQWNNLDLA